MKTLSSFYYLDFVNNFVTIQCFAEFYDLTIDQAKSIVSRSKIIWLAESSDNRKYFLNNNINLCDHYHGMSENNKVFFSQRHANNLLAEYSA